MVLKGIVVAPRWSTTSSSIVGIVVEPLVLELLSQSNATINEDFSKEHLLDNCVKDKGEMACVGYVCPLVGPAEGDGNLGPWAKARISGGIF